MFHNYNELLTWINKNIQLDKEDTAEELAARFVAYSHAVLLVGSVLDDGPSILAEMLYTGIPGIADHPKEIIDTWLESFWPGIMENMDKVTEDEGEQTMNRLLTQFFGKKFQPDQPPSSITLQ